MQVTVTYTDYDDGSNFSGDNLTPTEGPNTKSPVSRCIAGKAAPSTLRAAAGADSSPVAPIQHGLRRSNKSSSTKDKN
eukprot:scaffold117510_cov32-Tisochrysis_lutea.AAC.2